MNYVYIGEFKLLSYKIRKMDNSTVIDNIINWLNDVVYHLDDIICVVLPINAIIILTLSTLWAIYLIQKILKEYKNEKILSKLHNDYQEHSWLNAMKNFKSNRIKNILLLAICVSEVVMNAILVLDKADGFISDEESYPTYGWLTYFISSGIITFELDIDTFTPNNIFAAFTFSQCVLTFLIRILTQYMVYQYSYYKPYLNTKLELYITISCYVTLILTVVAFELHHIFLICCLFLMNYEFIRCAIAGRELSLLLRQRLYDAIRHENESDSVILYYKIAHKEYKLCFSIMLVATFLQNLALSILIILQCFIYGDIMKYEINENNIVYEYEYNYEYSHNNSFPSYHSAASYSLGIYMSNYMSMYLWLIPMTTVVFGLGSSIQILPYLIVSFRRIFRYIHNRRMRNKEFDSYRSSLKPLIKANNLAYNKRMR